MKKSGIQKRNWLVGLVLLSIWLSGCGGQKIKVIEATYNDGKPKTVKYFQGRGQERLIVEEIQYYPSGEKKLQGEYEDGKKDGKWIFYYENGKIWSKGFFKSGLRTGKTLVYHESGQLFYEGEYADGNKQGTWKFYNQEGQLVNKVQFEDGKIFNQSGNNEHLKDSSLID